MRHDQLEELVRRFSLALAVGSAQVRAEWRSRETLDVMEYILDVLFLRNAEIYDSLVVLLQKGHRSAAELLFRPLLEGVMIFEWCMQDPHPRALRFKRTSFQSTLELLDDGYIERSPEWVKAARDSVAWLESKGHKALPPMRQMIETTSLFKEVAGYNLYRLLAKKAHGFFENWAEFDPAQQMREDPQTERADAEQELQLTALSAFLQMRNLLLVRQCDPVMTFAGPQDLEEIWARIYALLLHHGKNLRV